MFFAALSFRRMEPLSADLAASWPVPLMCRVDPIVKVSGTIVAKATSIVVKPQEGKAGGTGGREVRFPLSRVFGPGQPDMEVFEASYLSMVEAFTSGSTAGVIALGPETAERAAHQETIVRGLTKVRENLQLQLLEVGPKGIRDLLVEEPEAEAEEEARKAAEQAAFSPRRFSPPTFRTRGGLKGRVTTGASTPGSSSPLKPGTARDRRESNVSAFSFSAARLGVTAASSSSSSSSPASGGILSSFSSLPLSTSAGDADALRAIAEGKARRRGRGHFVAVFTLLNAGEAEAFPLSAPAASSATSSSPSSAHVPYLHRLASAKKGGSRVGKSPSLIKSPEKAALPSEPRFFLVELDQGLSIGGGEGKAEGKGEGEAEGAAYVRKSLSALCLAIRMINQGATAGGGGRGPGDIMMSDSLSTYSRLSSSPAASSPFVSLRGDSLCLLLKHLLLAGQSSVLAYVSPLTADREASLRILRLLAAMSPAAVSASLRSPKTLPLSALAAARPRSSSSSSSDFFSLSELSAAAAETQARLKAARKFADRVREEGRQKREATRRLTANLTLSSRKREDAEEKGESESLSEIPMMMTPSADLARALQRDGDEDQDPNGPASSAPSSPPIFLMGIDVSAISSEDEFASAEIGLAAIAIGRDDGDKEKDDDEGGKEGLSTHQQQQQQQHPFSPLEELSQRTVAQEDTPKEGRLQLYQDALNQGGNSDEGSGSSGEEGRSAVSLDLRAVAAIATATPAPALTPSPLPANTTAGLPVTIARPPPMSPFRQSPPLKVTAVGNGLLLVSPAAVSSASRGTPLPPAVAEAERDDEDEEEEEEESSTEQQQPQHERGKPVVVFVDPATVLKKEGGLAGLFLSGKESARLHHNHHHHHHLAFQPRLIMSRLKDLKLALKANSNSSNTTAGASEPQPDNKARKCTFDDRASGRSRGSGRSSRSRVAAASSFATPLYLSRPLRKGALLPILSTDELFEAGGRLLMIDDIRIDLLLLPTATGMAAGTPLETSYDQVNLKASQLLQHALVTAAAASASSSTVASSSTSAMGGSSSLADIVRRAAAGLVHPPSPAVSSSRSFLSAAAATAVDIDDEAALDRAIAREEEKKKEATEEEEDAEGLGVKKGGREAAAARGERREGRLVRLVFIAAGSDLRHKVVEATMAEAAAVEAEEDKKVRADSNDKNEEGDKDDDDEAALPDLSSPRLELAELALLSPSAAVAASSQPQAQPPMPSASSPSFSPSSFTDSLGTGTGTISPSHAATTARAVVQAQPAPIAEAAVTAGPEDASCLPWLCGGGAAASAAASSTKHQHHQTNRNRPA